MIAESAILLGLTATNSLLSIDVSQIVNVQECAITKNNYVIEEIANKGYLNKNILILQNKNKEVIYYAIID